jgi:CRISPR-associated protein (TIGR03985 family)
MVRIVRPTAFPLFEDPPQVELLQWLARGSLKQNLLRSIRLWVWLQSLYGDTPIELSEPFTYAQWRDAFFSADHPTGEAVPELHDPNCACAQTTSQWLFAPQTGVTVKNWRRSLQQHTGILDDQLQQWLQKRLFAVTRRSLFADLQILVDLGWLTSEGNHYFRVEQFPNRPLTQEGIFEDRLGLPDLGFLNPNLETIAQSLSQPIAEVQRFYLEVDYIIAQTQRQVENWLELLKSIWETATVSPVKLVYRSAKFGAVESVVYPVCIYYVQRAIYLCGFGLPPSGQGNWYNYRLDKIEQMTVLSWQDESIPALLRLRQQNLPTPDYISAQMRRAWGFDFYLPADRYIQGTFRHHTFKQLTQAQVRQMIQDYADVGQRQALLEIVRSRSKQDAYYSVVYRVGDTNVELRLRAWRPNVEVLLPWGLRLQVSREVGRESQFYFG